MAEHSALIFFFILVTFWYQIRLKYADQANHENKPYTLQINIHTLCNLILQQQKYKQANP